MDEHLVRQCRHRRAVTGDDGRGCDGDDPVTEQHLRAIVRIERMTVENPHMHAVAVEVDRIVLDPDIHLPVAPVREPGGQPQGKPRLGHGRQRAEHEAGAPGDPLHPLGKAANRRERVGQRRIGGQPRIGQRQPVALAQEERAAPEMLQDLHLLADRSRSDPELPGGGGEGTCSRRRLEGGKRFEGGSCHVLFRKNFLRYINRISIA